MKGNPKGGLPYKNQPNVGAGLVPAQNANSLMQNVLSTPNRMPQGAVNLMEARAYNKTSIGQPQSQGRKFCYVST